MGDVLARYLELINEGTLQPDAAQRKMIDAFDALAEKIHTHTLARKSSALGWLFGKRKPQKTLQGLYLWGAVGRGKTMMMNLFFESLNVKNKRRAHFHAFMADVHQRVYQWRQKAKAGLVKGTDPIENVADELAEQAWILCFDEFSVTDITDAMILGRLFQALLARRVIIIATSNVEPKFLYHNGLNRALFLPFIDLITREMEVIHLDARTDYRLEKLAGHQVFYTPDTLEATTEIDKLFQNLIQGERIQVFRHDLGGRFLELPISAAGVARVSFAELCEKPLGNSDFLALAENFHTLILEHIPQLDFSRRNEAKRFINLIDILYENKVKLIASSAVAVEKLYHAPIGHEAFEFDRTISRLIEMRAESYLTLPHASRLNEANGASTGLVET